jgi:hypothetical protein
MGSRERPLILVGVSGLRANLPETPSQALALRDARDHAASLRGRPAPEADGRAGRRRSSTGVRLLLVEDSPQDAALHTAMLRSTALSELIDVVVVDRLTE